MVWQVFFSELELLTSLPHYVCVAKQKKLQNISPLHALFIQDKDNKSFNPQDFTTIISNPELLQKFLYWFMSLKRLNQFNLAFKLHYSQSNT